jgi:hypothetical protein
VLFHVLFITQENYFFAALKGFTIYGMVFLLIFAFPFIFSFSLVNRLKLILISAVLVFGMTFLYSEMIFNFKPTWKLDIYSALGDPIGEEVDKINNNIETLFLNEHFPRIPTLDSLLNLTKIDSSVLIHSKLTTKTENHRFARDSMKVLLNQVNFNTTKEFILVILRYIENLETYNGEISKLLSILKDVENDGIDLKNLKDDYERSSSIVDSLFPQISYIFELKPDEKGLIHANPEDTQMFRWLVKIAERSNFLGKAYNSILKNYTNVQASYDKLYQAYLEYLDKKSSLLDIRIILFKYYLIAPDPY